VQPAPAETMAIDITLHLWLLLLGAKRQPHDLLLEVCARRADFANPHVHPEGSLDLSGAVNLCTPEDRVLVSLKQNRGKMHTAEACCAAATMEKLCSFLLVVCRTTHSVISFALNLPHVELRQGQGLPAACETVRADTCSSAQFLRHDDTPDAYRCFTWRLGLVLTSAL